MRSTPSRSIIDIENLQHFSDTLTIIYSYTSVSREAPAASGG
jgi:hypothetical protein